MGKDMGQSQPFAAPAEGQTECERVARDCASLAALAKTPYAKRVMLDAARSWWQLARLAPRAGLAPGDVGDPAGIGVDAEPGNRAERRA